MVKDLQSTVVDELELGSDHTSCVIMGTLFSTSGFCL